MRKLLLSALIGMTFLCPISIMAAESSEVRQIEIGGYDISFPEDWIEKADSITLDGGDVESYYVTKIYNDTTGILDLSALKLDSDQLSAEAVLQVGKQMENDYLSQMFDPFAIESSEPYEVEDTTGLMIKFTGKIGDNEFVGRDLVFAGMGEHRYMRFIFVESPKDSVALGAEYWKILDSIKVHPVIEPPFDDLNILFYNHMNNDVTGEWRVALTSTPHPVRDYIEYYYKTYVKPEDAVHVIVNFTLKTTTLIRGINSYIPYFEIATYEYADGDEHDAKQCPGGMSYGSDIVFTDTWEVMDWDEYWDAIEAEESEDW